MDKIAYEEPWRGESLSLSSSDEFDCAANRWYTYVKQYKWGRRMSVW